MLMNCQSTFKGGNKQLRYVHEIVFNMLEGFGVLNFGAGSGSIKPLGKS